MSVSRSIVAKLLLDRKAAGSRPGHRDDGRRIALAIEGGGMRGVVSAGMVSALEEIGLRDAFDAVFGSSAGAISGAYFVARQARYGTTIFYEDINNTDFINIARWLTGKPILSLEYLLDYVCVTKKALQVDAVRTSDVPLLAVASSLTQHKSVVLTDFADNNELIEALRASARIPYFAGRPVKFRSDLLTDASIYEPIPFRAAQARGYTDIVVLLTRPAGSLRSKPGWIDRLFVAPHIRRYSAAAAEAYMRRDEEYARDVRTLFSRSDQPNFLIVQIDANEFALSPFHVVRDELVAAAKAGFRATYAALGFKPPLVVELLSSVQT
jgi:predicted patatin/cPLA2 family phospholipase